MQRLDLDKEVILFALNGRLATDGANRVNQIDGTVRVPALIAVVTVLIHSTAFRATSFDKAIWQCFASFAVKQFDNGSLVNQSGPLQRRPKVIAECPILRTVRAAIVVKLDIEVSEVTLMRVVHLTDKLFFTAAQLAGTLHDGGAVRVVRTDIDAPLTSQFLETHPDICLDVFHEMSDVNGTVSVRQRRGDQDPALVHLSLI